MNKLKSNIEVWAVLGLSVLFCIIYGRYQLLYTFYFTYQIALFFFPAFVPEISQQPLP